MKLTIKEQINMKKLELITREEAAEMLGVTRSTISNWIDEGYFKIFRPNKMTIRIYKSSFEEFVEGYSISRNTKILEEREKELREKIEDTEARINAIKEFDLARWNMVNKQFWKESISKLLSVIDENDSFLTEIEYKIVLSLLTEPDIDLEELSREYDISKLRLHYLCGKIICKIDHNVTRYSELVSCNNRLQRRLKAQKISIDNLKLKLSKQSRSDSGYISLEHKLGEIKLCNCDISTRSIKSLEESGITNMYQLLCRSDIDLLKFRNFGNRSLGEIKRLVDKVTKDLHLDIPLFLGMFKY